MVIQTNDMYWGLYGRMIFIEGYTDARYLLRVMQTDRFRFRSPYSSNVVIHFYRSIRNRRCRNLKQPSTENPELSKVLSSQPCPGQNTTRLASSASVNSARLISTVPLRPTSCFPITFPACPVMCHDQPRRLFASAVMNRAWPWYDLHGWLAVKSRESINQQWLHPRPLVIVKEKQYLKNGCPS